MFCSTLRKRREWGTLPATLLSIQGRRWQEKLLETHDLRLPIAKLRQDDEPQFFRLLLLSASDIQDPANAMPRIERLYHQTGGRQVGIVFLLQEKMPSHNGTYAYMNIQASLMGAFDLPIIPLHSLTSFQETLEKFWQQLTATTKASQSPKANPAALLLPYCTLSPVMPEHSRNVLGEHYRTIADVAQAAVTRDGQMMLHRLLPKRVAEEVIGFWEQEYCTE